jgi:hypothetical protein
MQLKRGIRRYLGKVVRFGQLPWREQVLLVQAASMLLLVDWSLKRFGLRHTYHWLQRCVKPRPISVSIARLGRIVEMGANNTIGADGTCLRRSLVLWWLLANADVHSELYVGFAKHEEELVGHAWVEVNKHAINDAMDVRLRYGRVMFGGSSSRSGR